MSRAADRIKRAFRASRQSGEPRGAASAEARALASVEEANRALQHPDRLVRSGRYRAQLRHALDVNRRRAVGFRMSEAAGDFLADMMDRGTDAAAAVIRRYMVPIAQHAIREWPVRTGESQSRLSLTARPHPVGMAAIFASPVGYTYKIRYARTVAQHRIDNAQKNHGFGEEVARAVRSRMRARGETLDEAVAWAAAQFRVRGGQNTVRRFVKSARLVEEEQVRVVYRTPTGGDAAGMHAWSTQASRPFRAMTARAAEEATRILGGRDRAVVQA